MAQDSAIARRYANQCWGEVQYQNKVCDGVWFFSTTGHGGFIVDTDKYPRLNRGMRKGRDNQEYPYDIVYIRKNSNYYRAEEQHFAAFEEDCEYAKVYWCIPAVRRYEFSYYSKSEKYRGEDYDTWWVWREGRLRESLDHYFPEFLEKYPNPL